MTRNTLERIWLGAGTIHKGLTLTTGTTGGNAQFNFEKTLLCATSGGNSLEITSTLYDVPIDGVGIKVYGGVVKTGETGTMTINALDMTPELLNHALFSDLADSQGAKDYLIGSTAEDRRKALDRQSGICGRNAERPQANCHYFRKSNLHQRCKGGRKKL